MPFLSVDSRMELESKVTDIPEHVYPELGFSQSDITLAVPQIYSRIAQQPHATDGQPGFFFNTWFNYIGPQNIMPPCERHFRPVSLGISILPQSLCHFGNDLGFFHPTSLQPPLQPPLHPQTNCMSTIGSWLPVDQAPDGLEPLQGPMQSPTTIPCAPKAPSIGSHKAKSNQPHQRFECSHSGCGRFFRHRRGLTHHLICHSGDRPHVCWVPDCRRKFSRRDNLNAHYVTHGKRNRRNCYVATLDPASSAYNPGFCGQLTPEGWPLDYIPHE